MGKLKAIAKTIVLVGRLKKQHLVAILIIQQTKQNMHHLQDRKDQDLLQFHIRNKTSTTKSNRSAAKTKINSKNETSFKTDYFQSFKTDYFQGLDLKIIHKSENSKIYLGKNLLSGRIGCAFPNLNFNFHQSQIVLTFGIARLLWQTLFKIKQCMLLSNLFF